MANQGQLIALFNAELNPNSRIQIARWPAGVVGGKILSGATPAFGAWIQVVAAAKIADQSWITALFLDNPDNAGAVETWVIDLGLGAAGLEVSQSSGTNVPQGIVSTTQAWLSSVGSSFMPQYLLPRWLNAFGQPRVAAAAAGLIVGAKNVYVSIQTITGLGK